MKMFTNFVSEYRTIWRQKKVPVLRKKDCPSTHLILAIQVSSNYVKYKYNSKYVWKRVCFCTIQYSINLKKINR